MAMIDIAKRIGDAHGISVPGTGLVEAYSPADVGNYSIIQKDAANDLWGKALAQLGKAPQDGDYASFVMTYSVLPWVYISAWLIASAIGAFPLRLYKGDRDEPEEVTSGDIYDLFMYPNPFDSMDMMVELLVLYLELSGNGFWECTDRASDRDLPVKFFHLEPQFTTVVPDPELKVRGYKYQPSASIAEILLEPHQVIHFKYANPSNPFYGQGTVKALQTSLVTELNREAYSNSVFENEARPDVIIRHLADTTKGIPPLTPAQRQEIADRWRDWFGGPRKTRRPVVLPTGADISLLTESIPDMAYREFEKSLRERVLGAFGVYPAIAGLFEYANYANTKEQVRLFHTVTIPPKCRRMEHTLNYFLNRLETGGDRYWCEFDRSDIPALDESPGEKSERLNMMFDRGVVSRGEYRAEMNYNVDPDDPTNNMKFISSTYVPLSDLTSGGTPGESPEETQQPDSRRF